MSESGRQAVIEQQLNRAARMILRGAISRMAAVLDPAEEVVAAASCRVKPSDVGEVRYPTDNGVVAVTDRRVLLVTGSHELTLPYDRVTDARRSKLRGLQVATNLPGTLRLADLAPGERAAELAGLIAARADGAPRVLAPDDPAPVVSDAPGDEGEETAGAGTGDEQPDAAGLDKTALAELKARHERRVAAWEQAAQERVAAEKARQGAVAAAVEQLRELRRGRRLAALPGKATLYAGELHHDGRRHPLSAAVRATVEQAGNVSASQGWVMRTQHDSRELYLNVEGPDWFAAIRAAKGSTASTDLSVMAANAVFRAESRRARDFAAKINTAAAQFPAFARESADALRAAGEQALAAHRDVAAVEAAVAAQRALLGQRAEAAADLDELSSHVSRMGRGPSSWSARTLARALQREVDGYVVHGFMPDADVASVDAITALATLDGALARGASDGETRPPQPTEDRLSHHVAQLVELREAGVLSDAEFAEKVAHLHARRRED